MLASPLAFLNGRIASDTGFDPSLPPPLALRGPNTLSRSSHPPAASTSTATAARTALSGTARDFGSSIGWVCCRVIGGALNPAVPDAGRPALSRSSRSCAKLSAGLIPLRRIRLGALVDNAFERFGYRRIDAARRRQRVLDARHQLGDGALRSRRLPRPEHHVVENQAEGVDIRALIDRPRHGLLRAPCIRASRQRHPRPSRHRPTRDRAIPKSMMTA